MKKRMRLFLFLVVLLLGNQSGQLIFASPFATKVLDYTPAPGQRVNNIQYNNPNVVPGSPNGGNTDLPQNEGVVTLGGFGGSVTLGFDHTVVDDPDNPLGLDVIVFSNAFWIGNSPYSRWQEPGIIEISKDNNGNGEADDPWYLIPGSQMTPPYGNYQHNVTYNRTDPAYPPEEKSWYPSTVFFSAYPDGITLSGYILPSDLAGAYTNPGSGATEEVYGYADLSPTGSEAGGDNLLYLVPDDPLTVGMDIGSGGGDAFDIAWAVDPNTDLPANLDSFDFIRITTAVDKVDAFGEASTEISAVADVAALRAISLRTGWNLIAPGMIGGENGIDWERCSLTDGVTTYNPVEAGLSGWIQTEIFYFDGGADLFENTTDNDEYLRWYRGYWLWGNQPGIRLLIPLR